MAQNSFCSFIGLIISIIALVYLFKIRSDTKEDIFQQPIDPALKGKFFYSTNTTPAINPVEVGIKCELYQEAIMNPKVTKLGDFFNLNIENIHSKATILLVIFILSIIMLFLTILALYLLSQTKSLLFIFLTCILSLGNVALIICNLVVSILFFLSYYNGDTYRFVEFLSCKNVNKSEFGNYLFAEKLKKHFTVFVVLNIINLFINSTLNTLTYVNKQQQQQPNNAQQEVAVKTI